MLFPPLIIDSGGGNRGSCVLNCDWNWDVWVLMSTPLETGPCDACTPWFCCKKYWFGTIGMCPGRLGHLFAVCPVDLHPLQVARSWPCSRQALQWRRGCCPCSNPLNIRPVAAVRSLLFRLVCARFSASLSRRRCRLIGLRIGGGGGTNSVPGGGRCRCQCGWKSAGVIVM